MVGVYRFKNANHEVLGSPNLPDKPVLDKIADYLKAKDRYAYEQLLLLSIIATTRRLPVIGWIPGLSLLLRTLLDNAFSVLAKITAQGKEPIICSELVHRCYKEAGQDYDIDIIGADIIARGGLNTLNSARNLAAPVDLAGDPAQLAREKDLEEAQLQADAFLKAYRTACAPPKAPVATKAVSDFVTPRDLENSPSLEYIGNIKG